VPEIIREIEERLQLTPEESKAVREVLAFSRKQGVQWNDQFRLGFLSHMISLIRRARDNEWVAEMDESLFDELSPEAIALAEDMVKAFTETGAQHRSEVLLVSTHYEMALRKES
jgi:PRD domain protein (TIGR03582 family)